ncbi:MAG: hypothetical protein GX540_00260 [Clostridiales bacterium]|nr:hypothetical protein [Clostridiales bacterium]
MNKPIDQSLDVRLSGLVMGASHKHRVLAAIKEEGEPKMKKKLSLGLALALIILLVGLATAFALTNGFGLLDVMSKTVMDKFGVARPEAAQMVKKDLAEKELAHTKVAIKEAAYDGKFLRVVYSVQAKGVDKPLADKPTRMEELMIVKDENSNDTYGVPEGPVKQFLEAARADGVPWETMDNAEADGQSFDPLGPTGSLSGENPGEVLSWVQFDLSGAQLADPFTVKLMIAYGEKPEYLTFQLPSTNLPGVKRLKLPEAKRIHDYSIQVTETLITPLRVYVAAEITVDAGIPIETCNQILGDWLVNPKLADKDGNLALAWIDSQGAGYAREDGNVAHRSPENDFKGTIINPEKPVKIVLSHEFMTTETYPDPLRFGVNDMDYILIPFEEAK